MLIELEIGAYNTHPPVHKHTNRFYWCCLVFVALTIAFVILFPLLFIFYFWCARIHIYTRIEYGESETFNTIFLFFSIFPWFVLLLPRVLFSSVFWFLYFVLHSCWSCHQMFIFRRISCIDPTHCFTTFIFIHLFMGDLS